MEVRRCPGRRPATWRLSPFITACEACAWRVLRIRNNRHSVASHAVKSDENLPQVGKLLGHSRDRMTAGCAQRANGHLVEIAERADGLIAEAMAGYVTSD